MKQNVNIKDIARIAGVGVSTVSRVINNHADVKKETKEKVLEIIEEYNYIPNNSARNLKRTETKTIGVLVKGIYNPFFSKIVRVIEMEIDKHEYSMILHYNSNNPKEGSPSDIDVAIELIKEKKLSGLICLGGSYDISEAPQIKEIETPIVICSAIVTGASNAENISTVSIDDEMSSYKGVEKLIEFGHKNIGMIRLRDDDVSGCKFRFEGYKKALSNNNITYNEDYIAVGDYSFETGHDAMKELIDKDTNISAVFVATDLMAIGATRAILESGKRVPEDISVLGFDGIEFAEFFMPSISTIKQPVIEMGEKSVESLFELISGCENNQYLFDTSFVTRESLRKI